MPVNRLWSTEDHTYKVTVYTYEHGVLNHVIEFSIQTVSVYMTTHYSTTFVTNVNNWNSDLTNYMHGEHADCELATKKIS